MTSALFEAFVGSHFDPLFSSAAAFAGAEDAAALNVPKLHAVARSGIMKVASNAARRLSDATTRILLIDGDAGFGKTHVLTSTLFQLAQEGDVLPVAFQLSADIGEDEIIRRLLRATVRELEARHFRDTNGWVPLRHLAIGLLELADYDREAFDKAVADVDEEAAAAEALKAAGSIVRALKTHGEAPPDEHLVAAILLTAERVSSAARRWLLGYSEATIGPLTLPAFESESDVFDVLLGISVLGAAIDAPLVLAFDQVEAALAAGSEVLVARVVTQACQLAELSPSIAVVFCALSGTFPASVLPRLHASIRDRIRHPPSQPIHLKAPDVGILRTVVDRRCEELVRRAGLEPHPEAGRIMVPTWLIEQHTGQSIRELFREIRDYRELSRALGRFAEASEFSASRPPKPLTPSDDFDKLWENAKDRDAGVIATLTDHERAALFVELLRKSADELANVSKTVVAQRDSGAMATRLVDVTFFDQASNRIEKWTIAFTDEPNSQGQFRDQLTEFLDERADGRPAIIRRRPIPGVKEGKPRRDRDLSNLQAGPAIRRLFSEGGRAAYAPDPDWARLRLALDFCRDRADAVGFLQWRKARRFLLEGAAIGEMIQLAMPSRTGDTEAAAAGEALEEPRRMSVDPRDAAQLFFGFAPDKRKILWDLDRTSKPLLPNFGLLVSGDADQGRTQLVKALVADTVQLGCPVLIFDHGGELADSNEDPFASDHGFDVIDLQDGLPFNPFRLPPRGASGSQPIEHVFEVTGILRSALSLTEQQTAILRSAIEIAFRKLGVPLREWVDPAATPAPSMSDVVHAAREEYERTATSLVHRLGALHEDRLLPSDDDASMTFAELVRQRVILRFDGLAHDDPLKLALAELTLLHAQAHMLRGETPRALRRMLVIDQAWRLADSDRLIAIAREGQAYGVAPIAMSQYADDVGAEVSTRLATKIHFFNVEPRRRRKVVQSTYGTTSSRAARDLLALLAGLRPYDGILRSPQHAPFERLTIEPYPRRRG